MKNIPQIKKVLNSKLPIGMILLSFIVVSMVLVSTEKLPRKNLLISPCNTKAVDARCGSGHMKCITGRPLDTPADDDDYYRWTCVGMSNGDSRQCREAKKKSIPTPTPTPTTPPLPAPIPTVIPGECGQPLYFGQYTWCALIEALNKAFQIFLYVFAPIATLMLVWGGIVYITSNGKEEKTEQAKKILLYTVIGIVIVTAIWGLITLAANAIPK